MHTILRDVVKCPNYSTIVPFICEVAYVHCNQDSAVLCHERAINVMPRLCGRKSSL